jgi:hypothetical protein
MPRKTGVLGSQDIVGIARRHHFRAYEQGWSTPIIGPGFRTLTLDYMQPARVCKLAYHQSTLPLAQMKVLPPSQNVFHRAHLTYCATYPCSLHITPIFCVILHARGASTIRENIYTLYIMLKYNYLDAAL